MIGGSGRWRQIPESLLVNGSSSRSDSNHFWLLNTKKNTSQNIVTIVWVYSHVFAKSIQTYPIVLRAYLCDGCCLVAMGRLCFLDGLRHQETSGVVPRAYGLPWPPHITRRSVGQPREVVGCWPIDSVAFFIHPEDDLYDVSNSLKQGLWISRQCGQINALPIVHPNVRNSDGCIYQNTKPNIMHTFLAALVIKRGNDVNPSYVDGFYMG